MLKVGKDRKESIHRKLKGYDLDSPAWYGSAHLQSQLSKKLKLEGCRFKARMSILTRSWITQPGMLLFSFPNPHSYIARSSPSSVTSVQLCFAITGSAKTDISA